MRKIASIAIGLLLLMSSYTPLSSVMTPSVSAQSGFTLNAEAGNGVVRLWWDEVPGAKQGYYLYRGPQPGQQYTMPLTDFGILGNTYYDKTVVVNENYCYYATAIDENATEFDRSNEVCVSVKSDLPEFVNPCKLVLVFTVNSAEYLVNGVKKVMSTPCIVRDNRTYLLIRYVAEEVGAEVGWVASEKKVTVKYKDKFIEMWIGKSIAKVNGVETPIDPNNPRVVPFIEQGRTHIPLRFPVESFGEGEVKWFASTKQAVLEFPDQCEETHEGVLTRYSSDSGLGFLLGFDGEPYLLANLNNLENGFRPEIGDCLRVTGRNDNPDYPGYLFAKTAELIECPDDGTNSWTGKIAEIDCERGLVKFVDEDGNTQTIIIPQEMAHLRKYCYTLAVGQCIIVNGTIVIPTTTTAALPYINPYSIEIIECPGETPEYECDGDWFSGKIISINCLDAVATVKLLSGMEVDVNLPDDADCGKLDIGWCVRFCGNRIATNVINAAIFKAFPCQEEVCDGELFRGKVLGVNCDANTLKIEQGTTYIEFDITGLDCEEIKGFKCVEVCAIKTQSGTALTHVAWKWVASKVTELDESECEDSCDGRIIQGKVKRIDCDKGTILITDLNAGNSVKIWFTDRKICSLKADTCIEVCLESNANKLTAKSVKVIDCPNECDGRLLTGTLTEVEPNRSKLKIAGTDKEVEFKLQGNQYRELKVGLCIEGCFKLEVGGSLRLEWFEILDTKACDDTGIDDDCNRTIKGVVKYLGCREDDKIELEIDGKTQTFLSKGVETCQGFEVGDCVEACIKDIVGAPSMILSMKKLDASECKPEEKVCDGLEMIVHVLDTNCDANSIKIKIIEALFGKGMVLEISLDGTDILCEQIEKNSCLRVCGKMKGMSDFELIWWEEIPPEKCGIEEEPECDEVVVGTIKYLGCREDDKIELEVDGVLTTYLSKGVETCQGFEIGDCVEACIKKIAGAPPVILYMKKLDPSECGSTEPECERTEIGKIVELGCTAYGYVKIETQETTKEHIVRDIDVCEDFAVGDCVILCFITDANGREIVDWMDKLPPARCEELSDCEPSIKLKVQNVWCENRYIEGIKVPETQPPTPITIRFDDSNADLFCQIEEGSCIEVCYNIGDFGGTWGISWKEIECPESFDCDGITLIGEIMEIDCYNLTAKVHTTGGLFEISVASEICRSIQPGCYMLCVVSDDETNIKIAKAVPLPDSECPLPAICLSKVVTGEILALYCDMGIIKVDTANGTLAIRINPGDCRLLKLGQCVDVCVKESADGELEAEWITVNDPTKCEGECREIRGTVERVDYGIGLITISGVSGTTHILAEIEDESIKEGDCIVACVLPGEENRPLKAVWVKVLSKEECQEENACDDIIQVKVDNVWCENRYIEGMEILTVEARSPMPVKIHFESGVFCRMQAGRCYEVCVKYDDDGVMWGVEYRQINCGDEADCEYGYTQTRVRKTDCDQGIVYLEIDGEIVKVSVRPEICDRLEVGMCLEVCLGHDEDGRLTILDYKLLPEDECPGAPCDGGRWLSGKVITMDSDDVNHGILFMLYGFSEEMFYEVDQRMGLLPFNEGDCVKVCVKYDASIGKLVVEKLVRLPDNACPDTCDGELLRGIIHRIDCENGILAVRREGSLWSFRVSPELCKRFREGDCIVACGTWQEETGIFVTSWVKKLPARLCGVSCEGKVAEGQILDIDYTNSTMKIQVDSTEILVSFPNSDLSDLKPTLCVKFCFDRNPETETFVGSWFEVVDCVPETPCEFNKYKAIIANNPCEDGHLFVWVNGNRFEVVGVDFMPDCEMFMRSKCVEICGQFSQALGTLTHAVPIVIEATSISILPDEECDYPTDVWVGVLTEIGELGQAVISRDGAYFSIQLPEESLETVEEGMCVKAGGRWIDARQIFVANWVKPLPPEECRECDGFETDVNLVDLNCDEAIGYAVKDGFLVKVTFENPEICAKILTSAFSPIRFPLCVSLCGEFDEDGMVFIAKDARLEPQSECVSVCAGPSFTGKVVEIGEDGKLLKLDYTNGDDSYPEYLRIPPYLSFVEGQCIKVCTQPMSNYDAMVDMPWYPLIVWSQNLPPEVCGELACEGETVRGTVTMKDCENGYVYATLTDGSSVKFSIDPALCTDLIEGNCHDFCVVWTDNLEDRIVSFEHVSEGACGQLCRTVRAKVAKVYCGEDSVTVRCVSELGQHTLRLYGADCDKYSNATCIEFCLLIRGGEVTNELVGGVTVLRPEECGETEGCENGEYWNIEFASIDCSTGNVVINNDGHYMKAKFANTDDCKKVTEGFCYKVCVTYSNRILYLSDPVENEDDNECAYECFLVVVKEVSCNKRHVKGEIYSGGELNIMLPKYFDCAGLAVGDCLEVCGKINDWGVTAQFAQEIKCPSRETVKFEGKISSQQCDEKLIYVTAGKTRYLVMIPDDIDCSKLKVGLCVVVEGYIPNTEYKNEITATSIKIVDCPTTEQTWNGVVTRPYCIEGILYCEVADKTCLVYVPESIKCEAFAKGDCVTIKGKYNQYSTSESPMIDASSITKVDCPEDLEEFDMIVFDTFCSSEFQYYIARQQTTFYPVYLPSGFDCSSIKPGDCIKVKGLKKSSSTGITTTATYHIEARSITKMNCESYGPYSGVVTGKYCSNRYLKVRYFSTEYIFFYPKSFNCDAIQVGNCISFTGVIWTKGYIDVTSVQKVDCPQKEETHTIFIVKIDCTNKKVTGVEGKKTYIVNLPRSFKCESLKVGTCLEATGVVKNDSALVLSTPSIDATSSSVVSCGRQMTATVKIKEVKCSVIGGVQFLIVEYNNKSYYLFFTSSYACTRFKEDTCYEVLGYFDNNNNYIHATSLKQVNCPVPESTVYGIVLSTYCDAKYPYAYISINGVTYTVTLQKKTDCTSLSVGSCVMIKGVVDTSGRIPTIGASSVTKIKTCPTFKFTIKITNVDTKTEKVSGYIGKYSSYWTWKMPRGTSLSSLKVGSCYSITATPVVSSKTSYLSITSASPVRCP
ncbi:MAG TPA: copper amine oxidase N-terminal domain-containing protein [Caldisericia bacterium]|nr:copper amine oxidase N-terminal domain-containing protein [Caldisericia bacterium]HPF48159.1 copper amine oxidase N-terminal domain-containing protein [Caldisericia bacterium]HPI83905.1 copper amine oxidase N-terminal domain-containing protein [Caldisericia bacterium]HPQ92612.1 copper amine oxidase N-terminal domain-containing protein [Caldisericia bacterium]HRV74290.1 copper amine oxidase N-terminal domain-containing protein [Caldisericia bacterium]